jgi:hypothetical protein
VRPWKARSKARTLARPVANDASLMAFSFASAPELHKNSEYESYPLRRPRRSASCCCREFCTELE